MPMIDLIAGLFTAFVVLPAGLAVIYSLLFDDDEEEYIRDQMAAGVPLSEIEEELDLEDNR